MWQLQRAALMQQQAQARAPCPPLRVRHHRSNQRHRMPEAPAAQQAQQVAQAKAAPASSNNTAIESGKSEEPGAQSSEGQNGSH